MPTNQQSEQYQDYLVEAFSTEASKEADKFAVFALAAGAAVWGLSGNAIAGIALGGCILLYSDRGIRNSNRALEAMQRNQIAAPFLKGDSFQDFRREFGDTLTLEQLKQAHEYGLPMQAIAETYLYEQCPDMEHPHQIQPDEQAAALTTATEARQPLAAFYNQFRFRPTLIWGSQGSGKTTVAKAIVADKVANGQKVTVVNPHGSPTAWGGLPVVGAGRNYAEVNDFLKHYLTQITARYQQFADSGLSEDAYLQHLITSGLVWTVICEEMSEWSHQLDPTLLHEFSQDCLTATRKVGLPPVFVTHDPTLSFLGLKKGAKLRDDGMVTLALEPGVATANGELISTGKGTLEIPKQQPIPIQFDAPTNSEGTPKTPLQRLEDTYKLNAPEEFITTPQAPVKMPSELHRKLAEYLQQKQEYPVRKIVQNWGSDKKLNASDVSGLLADLMQLGLIDTFSPADTNAEWVRWIGSI